MPDIGLVEARDVADLHVRALSASDRAGERFIASGPLLKLLDIAEIVRAQLGEQAHKVPACGVPDWLVRLIARFKPGARAVGG